jgi:catechol-2,3-dioxygenase
MPRPVIDPHTKVAPLKLAHIVLRTARLTKMRDWYVTVLNGRATIESPGAVSITYDSEHHRVALVEVKDLRAFDTAAVTDARLIPTSALTATDDDQDLTMFDLVQAPGLEHVAFTYPMLGDLLSNYVRLRDIGIRPRMCINHGPTLSLYYCDPDGNKVELQIDTMPMDQAEDFAFSDRLMQNPIGVPFDPQKLVDRYWNGESVATLVQVGWDA